VSGLSGAGKSVVLHALEDLGHYCVDNLPASMLEPFVAHTLRADSSDYPTVAIGIDARDTGAGLDQVPVTIEQLRRSGLRCELVMVTAADSELLRRYGETKRRHPLSREGGTLQQAVTRERELLDPLIQAADLVVDTTHMGVHELRDVIVQRIDQRRGTELSVTLVSFGFKHGVPGDCDFVFDARTLPNPYWTVALRALTGRDPEVIEYLGAQPAVAALIEDLARFIGKRIEEHQAARRRYLTIGIGCTGGQHRSVYVVDRIADRLRSQLPALAVRHSALATRMSG
jgi:UPF0042 nucleotide-binding protein